MYDSIYGELNRKLMSYLQNIQLDELSVNITSSSLRTALYLTAADRRWIDSIVQAVAESWDENDPSRPNTMGFVGSEDYIRLQFEEYALSMVSSVKCHDFLQKHAGSASRILPDVGILSYLLKLMHSLVNFL